jgi:hypothetical protein
MTEPRNLKELADQLGTRVKMFRSTEGKNGAMIVGVSVIIEGKAQPAQASGSSMRKALDALGRLVRGRNVVTGPESEIISVPDSLDSRVWK